MRVKARTDGADFKATSIAGTETILIALDCPHGRCKDLKGFAFTMDRVAWGFVIESRLSPGVLNHQ